MPDSQAQVRLAAAIVHGRPRKKTSMKRDVAKEILEKMRGRSLSSLPKRKH